MKFEFDSNNATELRAVEAAVAVLLGKQAPKTIGELNVQINGGEVADALVAAVTEAQQKLEAEQPDLTGATMPVAGVDIPGEADMKAAPDAIIQNGVEVDSAGQPWNPELHSSSRAKVADGTWKKRRGQKLDGVVPNSAPPRTEPGNALIDAARGRDPVTGEAPAVPAPPVPAPATPPAPPVPVPAAAAPSAEQKIWALITGEVVTINRVLEVARDHGHADLGALRQADEAAKAEVLKVLEGE